MREVWRRQPHPRGHSSPSQIRPGPWPRPSELQPAPRHLGPALRPPSHPPHPWPQADPIHQVSEWVLLSIYTSTWKTDSSRRVGGPVHWKGVMGKTVRTRPWGQ